MVNFSINEINLIHDGTDVELFEYGEMKHRQLTVYI